MHRLEDGQSVAARLQQEAGVAPVFEASLTEAGQALLAIAGRGSRKRLLVAGSLEGVAGELRGNMALPHCEGPVPLRVCSLSAGNARAVLRGISGPRLDVLDRQRASFGFGDRIGRFTPPLLRAVMRLGLADRMSVVPAQMSVRELERIQKGYRPDLCVEDILARAVFGALEVGWRGAIGFDADHIKSHDWLERYLRDGQATLVTLDLIEHVRSKRAISEQNRQALLDAVPWRELQTSWADAKARYADRHAAADEEALAAFYVQYGEAVRHAAEMICAGVAAARGQIQFEISTDELDEVTEPISVWLMLQELQRLLGDRHFATIVSVAPRFRGIAEKGVNWHGPLTEFKAHAQGLAQALADHPGIRISLHSGSDKFQVYSTLRAVFGHRLHIKTAGTWWLELVRCVANLEPELFRRMAERIQDQDFALWKRERASYHVSAEPGRAGSIGGIDPRYYMSLMDGLEWRQMFHVCYGPLLEEFRGEINAFLDRNEEWVYQFVEDHARKHLSLLV